MSYCKCDPASLQGDLLGNLFQVFAV